MRYFLVLSLAGFVAAQGMDPWQRMKRFDSDGDGKVTREEFRGSERMFDRFDKDNDGVITQDEVRRRGSDSLQRAADSDKDGKVSKEEWTALFDRMDTNGDGTLDASEFRTPKSVDRAPKQGSPAPKVTVTRRKDGKKMPLAPAGKPLVLIFGSWT